MLRSMVNAKLHQGDPLRGGGHGIPVEDGVAGSNWLLVPAVVDSFVTGCLHLEVKYGHPP